MSLFELITLTLSVVLGLSIAHILLSTASAIRSRKKLKLHWIPLAWAGCILLYTYARTQDDLLILAFHDEMLEIVEHAHDAACRFDGVRPRPPRFPESVNCT